MVISLTPPVVPPGPPVKIRILNHPDIPVGTIMEVSAQEATDWVVRRKRAEYVKDEPEAAIIAPIETAELAPPENAAVRTSKPPPRKR